MHGLAEGARKAGLEPPVALAVTVLTSEPKASATLLAGRVAAAVEAGCGGVVCAASDVAVVKGLAPQLLVVVPGIRPLGTSVDDQARPATPAEALAAGADLLVIGRAVTAAADPTSVGRRPGRLHSLSSRHRRPGRERPLPTPGRLAMVPGMPLPPSLSPDQRQAALDKAAAARRVRAELKEKLKMGSLSLNELLEQAAGDEVVAKMKVVAVLESLPGLGKVKARRLMEEIGISETRRIQGLGDQQRKKLLERLGQ